MIKSEKKEIHRIGKWEIQLIERNGRYAAKVFYAKKMKFRCVSREEITLDYMLDLLFTKGILVNSLTNIYEEKMR